MLKEFTSNNLITNSIVELGEVIDDTQGKGRSFVSRFIEAGVAHYKEFGDVLITKETLDKFIHTMVGCPVIINHKDITEKNADKERVGVVCEVWFEPMDGWYYCKGIIWDKQAIDLVKNQGWNVSCTYDFESDFIEKTHNGKKIDMEFTNGKFLHLALVNNPRYERANIVVNSKEQVENEKTEFVTVGEGDKKHVIPLDYINKDKKEKDREEKQKQAKDFDEIYKKMITPEVVRELNESVKAQLAENPNAKVGDTIIDSDKIISSYSQKLTPQEYSKFNWDKAEDALSDKLNELERARGFKKYKDEAELDKQGNKETKDNTSWKDKDYTNVSDDELREKMYDITKRLDKKHGSFENAPYSEKEEYYFYNNMLSKGFRSKGNNTDAKETKEVEKDTKTTKKDEDRHQKVRDLEDKAYKEFKTMRDNYIHGDVKISDFGKAKEQFNKKYKDAFDKLKSDRFVSFEDFAKRENKQANTKDGENKAKIYTEDTYDEFHKKFYKEHDDKWTFQRTTKGYDVHRTKENKKWEFNEDLKKENFDKYLTDEVVKLRLPNIPKKDKNGDTEFQEDTKNLQLFKDKGYEPTDKYNDGYYTNYILKKNDEKTKNNKVENRKDKITMSLFKDLEKFVENAIKKCDEKQKFEEEETIVDNEDKREIIDEVGGILKGKVDEEVWRTVIGKLEKIAYEPSEETKADNKCKNEDEEDEEEYEEMKEIAEDAEDKKGKKEEKKEEKKEVKNSMDDVAKMVYGQAETVKSYTTTAERLELGNNY